MIYENKEQERTNRKKKEFFENYIRCSRYIARTCEAINISRWTFYNWLKEDGNFANTLSDYELRTAYQKQMFAEAWAKMGGTVTDICHLIGISRWTYYNWRDSDPEFRRMVRDEFEAETERRRKSWEAKTNIY